ncbi:helix-turn-helix domain-containing protein [Clostridium sp. MT-14]|uniref:Helix-turn-helix domain-containing protein n=1 Tax=Clostridium aromativorans TaxID=2836848 RepID=A0ABS8N136_9CLOT|nr:helix-turn-helix domain-containing protein [Clostridium aromativorans]MCC9293507.1 helix-turn-helix domain-containing protein [Clostridium aromativorans]
MTKTMRPKLGGGGLIGLEYILGLYNMQHIELAKELGLKKQNINLWIKGKQGIPKKYLPRLEKMFGISKEYFPKELNEIEKLEIQKEKLKKELNPVIEKYDKQFMVKDTKGIYKVPIYDKEEMNRIERKIEKAKLVSKFKQALDVVDDNPYMDTYRLITELLSKAQQEVVLHRTIEALAHYMEVLPDKINSDESQDEFESEIFEIFDDYNF